MIGRRTLCANGKLECVIRVKSTSKRTHQTSTMIGTDSENILENQKGHCESSNLRCHYPNGTSEPWLYSQASEIGL